MFEKLLSFLAAIAILVVIHELGHYWVARLCGVKVLCFSVGFGKVLFKKRFAGGDTEWTISAIPLGGYVKMLDERETDCKIPEADLPYAFNRKNVWQRMAIVVAGPVANLLLAILFYWIIFVHGVEGLKPILGDIPQGTPAAIAQLRTGDTIVRVDDKNIPSWQDFGWSLLDLSMRKNEVTVVTRDKNGVESSHPLNVSALQEGELEGNYLKKLGLNLNRPLIQPVIGKVVETGAGAKAGLQAGDQVLRANGVDVASWDILVEILRNSAAKTIALDIKRGSAQMVISAMPETVVEEGKPVGKLGIAPYVAPGLFKDLQVDIHYSPLEALSVATARTWETSIITLKILGKMVTGQLSLKNISGPISIADYAGESAKNGFITFIGFLAFISVSIGVFNLLPVPILDGGHLMYYLVELIKGSPVSEQAWAIGQKIGTALLGVLMIFAIYNDINRYI